MTRSLPAFPDLAPIAEEHLERIREITLRYPSYSDFNMVSLWGWSAAGDFKVAELNDNLVVEFGDYLSPTRFLSVLGTTKVAETAEALLFEAGRAGRGLDDELHLVPEITAKTLADDPRFEVWLEADQADYLYDPRLYVDLPGNRFKKIRSEVNQFRQDVSLFEDYVAISGGPDLLQRSGVELLEMFDRWRALGTDGAESADEERRAFGYLIETAPLIGSFTDLRVSLGYLDGRLVHYDVDEVIDEKRGMGHFTKSFHFVRNSSVGHFVDSRCRLAAQGISESNCQQDLGIEGLRINKKRLRPSGMLNKFGARRK